MGKGFINQNSKIRIRMLTRHADQEINENFLRMRVKNAWEYRKTTVDTSSCRVIFGEADFLPGLVVDKYEDVLVVECLALGMEQFKETIVSLLKGVLKEDGISIRGVYERSDANERRKEGLPKLKGFIGETFDTEVEITENGVHYLVDVVNGQKTGFLSLYKRFRIVYQLLFLNLISDQIVQHNGIHIVDCTECKASLRCIINPECFVEKTKRGGFMHLQKAVDELSRGICRDGRQAKAKAAATIWIFLPRRLPESLCVYIISICCNDHTT